MPQNPVPYGVLDARYVNVGGDTVTGNLIVQPAADSVTGFQVLDADGGAPVLNVDTVNERVGFGTAAPRSTVHIGAGIDASALAGSTMYITENGITAFSVRDSTNNSEGFMQVGSFGMAFGAATNHHLIIQTANIERIRILNTGNVGINTTGPDRKLDILDASNPQIRITHTDGSVYVDLQAESDGDLSIEPSGSNINIIAKDILLDTTTGSKIGTAAAQKIGFWGVTPVIQQAHIIDADGSLADITTKFNTLLSQLEANGIVAAA